MGLRRYATAHRGLSVWYDGEIYLVNMHIHFLQFPDELRRQNWSFNQLTFYSNTFLKSQKAQIQTNNTVDIHVSDSYV